MVIVMIVMSKPMWDQGFMSRGPRLVITAVVEAEFMLKILEVNSALGPFKQERGQSWNQKSLKLFF